MTTLTGLTLSHARAAGGEAAGGAADDELLGAFLRGRDGAPLAELVRRHGPMVWGVCHRVLRDRHDAEDAFQATFLVLARRAGSVRPGGTLAPWLHGVACRTALCLRRDRGRRRTRELNQAADAPAPAAASEAERRDLRAALDEELLRLPRRYRAAVVLCYLQGHTYAEAARRLGCPAGTLAARLARARARLRARLGSRDLAPQAFVPAAAPWGAPAAPPAWLADATARGAAAFAAGGASPAAAALASEVLGAMTASRVRRLAAAGLLALLLAATAAGLGSLADRPPDGRPQAWHKSEGNKAEGKKAGEGLLGAWEVVETDFAGLAAPRDLSPVQKVIITPDRFIFRYADGGSREWRYRLDPSQKPPHLDLTGADPRDAHLRGATWPGIYRLEGQTLTVCLQNGGPVRPTEFRTAGDSGRLYMLRRLKPGRALPEGPAWGDPVGGLQCRLRADRAEWPAGAAPSFRLEVRNRGGLRGLTVPVEEAEYRMWADGHWYRRGGARAGERKARPLPPGGLVEGLTLTAGSGWERRLEKLVGPPDAPAHATEPLKLGPGRHTVRVAVYVYPARLGEDQPVRLESNPVEVTILPEKEGPGRGKGKGQ